MTASLSIFAGKEALIHIQQQGLCGDDIAMILAASGGPKWLSLASMDRYFLSEWFSRREKPLHVLGTSAGAWRMSCYAQANPLVAHARFQEAYISQQYASAKPSAQEVADVCVQILDEILGPSGIQEIVHNPVVRYHTIAARCKNLAALEHKIPQTLGLVAALTANAISRSAMRPWVERVLFHHAELPPITHFPHLPARTVPISEQNLRDAILASGAIPLVIAGIQNIVGAPRGTYRDGGITDYQFDLPALPQDGLVLYPHYFAKAPKGGWFDKKLWWRKANTEHFSRTVFIAPSWEFAATLPGGRIPDLDDFYDYPDYGVRRKRWLQALSMCERLGDELADIDQRQRWVEVVKPLPW